MDVHETHDHPLEDELLTAVEVAKMSRTSAATVRRWAREKKIPAVPLPGGKWRFRRADIEELLSPSPIPASVCNGDKSDSARGGAVPFVDPGQLVLPGLVGVGA